MRRPIRHIVQRSDIVIPNAVIQSAVIPANAGIQENGVGVALQNGIGSACTCGRAVRRLRSGPLDPLRPLRPLNPLWPRPYGRWAHARFTSVTAFIIVLLVGTLGFFRPALAQGVSKVGTTAADFLQIDVGPRAVAMGGAFVAGVDDASALYWNPAGISHMRGSEMIASHTEWVADLTFDYLGVGLDLGNAGVAGVSVTMLSVPDMIVRTVDRQDGTGETFDAADMALGVSYGRAITDRFSIGVTAKYIRQRIWHSEATGFAVDIGTQFRTDFVGGLTIGAVMSNFGSDMKLNGRDLRTFVDPDPSQLGNNNRVPANFELDSAKLPLNFQFGITTTPVNSRLHKVTLNADALHPNSNNESLNLGIEYGFQERVFLRGGYRGMFLDEAEGGLSGGLGVHQTLFQGGIAKLDYAFRAGGRLGDVHVVGFGLTF